MPIMKNKIDSRNLINKVKILLSVSNKNNNNSCKMILMNNKSSLWEINLMINSSVLKYMHQGEISNKRKLMRMRKTISVPF